MRLSQLRPWFGAAPTGAFRYFVPWYISQKPGRSPLRDQRPWINFPALNWLERFLNPTMMVFEWGAGGSTLFFSSRVAKVISTEHDPQWFEHVRRTITSSHVTNAECRFVPPIPFAISADAVDVNHTGERPCYQSGLDKYKGQSFESYVRAVDAFADQSLDVVLIDGRARMDCLRHAAGKISRGGALILDNSDYPRYRQSLRRLPEVMANWRRTSWYAPGPYSSFPFWETTVWQRPA